MHIEIIESNGYFQAASTHWDDLCHTRTRKETKVRLWHKLCGSEQRARAEQVATGRKDSQIFGWAETVPGSSILLIPRTEEVLGTLIGVARRILIASYWESMLLSPMKSCAHLWPKFQPSLTLDLSFLFQLTHSLHLSWLQQCCLLRKGQSHLHQGSLMTGTFFSISGDKYRPLPMSSGSDGKGSTYQPSRVAGSGMKFVAICKKATSSYWRITKLLVIRGQWQWWLLLCIAKMEKYEQLI